MADSNGVGFKLILKFGISIDTINRKLDHLHQNIEGSLMMHNLYETFNTESNKSFFEKNISNLIDKLPTEISDINKLIKFNNEFIQLMEFKKKIQPLNTSRIKSIINERFSNKLKQDDTQKLGNENFKLKLQNEVITTQRSIFNFIQYLEEEIQFNKKESVRRAYSEGVQESINLFSSGFYNTSVFVVGKTIEAIVNDLLRKQIRLKRIRRFNLNETKYKDKIGKLKGADIIDEKLFLDLNLVRIDRNEIGHPSSRTFTRDENQLAISKGILLIIKLQRKL